MNKLKRTSEEALGLYVFLVTPADVVAEVPQMVMLSMAYNLDQAVKKVSKNNGDANIKSLGRFDMNDLLKEIDLTDINKPSKIQFIQGLKLVKDDLVTKPKDKKDLERILNKIENDKNKTSKAKSLCKSKSK